VRKMTATIVAIDRGASSIAFEAPDGEKYTRHVVDPTVFDQVHMGDRLTRLEHWSSRSRASRLPTKRRLAGIPQRPRSNRLRRRDEARTKRKTQVEKPRHRGMSVYGQCAAGWYNRTHAASWAIARAQFIAGSLMPFVHWIGRAPRGRDYGAWPTRRAAKAPARLQ
jgi:hypothetical protein